MAERLAYVMKAVHVARLAPSAHVDMELSASNDLELGAMLCQRLRAVNSTQTMDKNDESDSFETMLQHMWRMSSASSVMLCTRTADTSNTVAMQR